MSASNFKGRFEAIIEGVAVGWALDASDLNQKPVVEILSGDYPVAFERADVFRADLETPADGDGCCGFEIMLPSTALIFGEHIRARIVNTGVLLPGVLEIADGGGEGALRRVSGEVHADGGLTLSGWATPTGFRTETIGIHVFEGDQLLAIGRADLPAPVSENGASPDAARCFRIRLPISLADGRPHVIDVRDDGGALLKGSPLTVAAWTHGPEALIEQAVASPQLEEDLRQSLRAMSAAFEQTSLLRPTSVDFKDYLPWKRAFSSTPVPASDKEEITVFIYGDGDVNETVNSLRQQGGAIRHQICPFGIILQNQWPQEGVVAFIQAGDTIEQNALISLAQDLTHARVVYSDCDQEVGGLRAPWFKPDWDPDLFLSQAYVFGLLAMRAEMFQFSGPSADVVKIVVTALNEAEGDIGHRSEILYHHKNAAASGCAPIAPEWLAKGLENFGEVKGGGGEITAYNDTPWLRRVIWPLPAVAPKVSVVIPTRDGETLLRRAVQGLQEATSYKDIEIIIVDNGSSEQGAVAYLERLASSGVKVLPAPGPFNYSALNNMAVNAASGEVICLLNNDVEVAEPGWLGEMVSQLLRPDVGIVGAKLLWSNGVVQHGGVVLGIDGGAAHVGTLWHEDDLGYCAANKVVRRYSAVTAACLVIRKSDYLDVEGLDEKAFPVTFNDVDLCLKIQQAGKAVVWTPFAKLYHHESATRGRDELPEKAARAYRELRGLRQRWGGVMLRDPFYNVNLNRDKAPYEGLALPPARMATRFLGRAFF